MSSADNKTSPQNPSDKPKVVLPPTPKVVLPPVPGSKPKTEDAPAVEAAKPVEAHKPQLPPAQKPVVLESAAAAPEVNKVINKPKVNLPVGSTGIDSKPLTIGRTASSAMATQSKPIPTYDYSSEDQPGIAAVAVDFLAMAVACAFAVLIFIQL